MTYKTVITGATGFVGGELLAKLLHESTRTLICPVRADSDEAARSRGHHRLVELVGPQDAQRLGERVEWIRADIEESQLGWSAATWHRVAMETAEIFHCAASISFDLPLDDSHRANVTGTQHVFELAAAAAARHPNFGRFHHVSTAYVAGRTKGLVTADFLPADRAGLYRNSYEQTKARAERFLRANASSQVPVSIHRPSIIAGHSRTGRTTNWNVLYVPMKMVARGALPAFVRGRRQLVDAVAVDVVADAMLAFSVLDSRPLESHHLTAGPTAFTVTDVIMTVIERARLHGGFNPSQTRLVGPVPWTLLNSAVSIMCRLPERAGAVRAKARLARRCIDRCSTYLPYAQVTTIFDATRDSDVLRVFGIEMPRGLDYLDTVITYALDTDFGKTAGAAHESAVLA